MTLKLPHPEAARELQRKLLAAGVVGVIIVGAATTAMWVPDNAPSVATGAAAGAAPIAAPAPISRGLLAEREDAIVATVPTAAALKAPESSGLRAEREDAIVATAATAATPKAPESSGLRAEREDAVVATPEEPSTQAQHQGMRAE